MVAGVGEKSMSPRTTKIRTFLLISGLSLAAYMLTETFAVCLGFWLAGGDWKFALPCAASGAGALLTFYRLDKVLPR